MTPGLAFTAAAFAVLNRARGSRFYGHSESTAETRLAATACMAAVAALMSDGIPPVTVFALTWAGLIFWAVWGWGKYFAAIHGHIDPGGGSLMPVDWLMRRLNLPTDTVEQRKIWGTVAMGLRQSLVAPCIVGLSLLNEHPDRAWLAALTPLFGLPYYICGKISQRWAVTMAELIIGALIGILIYNAITM